jgi:nucleoside phosphorylase
MAQRGESPARCALILTALEVETRAVLRHMPDRKTDHVGGTVFHRGVVEGWDVVVAEVGPGNAPAAVIAERAIGRFGPAVALFVGVAGGIKDVAIGDVVVGTKVYGYESGKETERGFKVRPDLQVTAHALEQQARAIRQQETWKSRLDRQHTTGEPHIYVGPIAAREKVVASAQGTIAHLLREHYGDALAIEMEGRGFLESIHVNSPVQGGVIRGISDLLEGKSEADAGDTQERAADAASAVAFEILATLPPESFGPRARTIGRPTATVALRSPVFDLRERPMTLGGLSDVRSPVVELSGAAADQLATPSVAIDNLAAAAGLNALNATLTQALEREFSLRYSAAIRRSLFVEAKKTNSFPLLARELIEGPMASISPSLRRRVLLHAARSAAVRGELQEAQRFLAEALALPGEDTDAPAKARLAEARGEVDEAIRGLRDRQDADSRSTLFNILYRARGDAAALAFLADHNLSVSDLTVNGIHTLCIVYLVQGTLEAVKNVLDQVSEEQSTDGPYLLLLRGAVRLATLFPKPDQATVLRGTPLDVRFARTVPSREIVSAELNASIADLDRVRVVAEELRLRDTRRIAETYVTWSEFLHPDTPAQTTAKASASWLYRGYRGASAPVAYASRMVLPAATPR